MAAFDATGRRCIVMLRGRMSPDFSKTTIDLLAKRAAFICSNPDCRAWTIGPNSDVTKATSIGEAAHIYGARSDALRYDPQMSDMARAEITNGIWLCRNCHGKVDRDAHKYPTELLFKWREEHDRHIASSLGNSERMRFDLEEARLREFADYPPIVRRIVIDKPEGWEWRLTAELLRHLNRPIFRKLRDLQAGLYTRPLERIDGNALPWVTARLSEMQKLTPPLEKLLERLNESWGPPGVPGDAAQIHHTCCLLRDAVQQIVTHEERLWFADVDEDFEPIVGLLKDCVGSQVLKLESIPDSLDEVVGLLDTVQSGTGEEPTVIRKIVTFDLPDRWEDQMQRELKRLERKLTGKPEPGSFWGGIFLLAVVVIVIFVMI